MKKLYIAIFIIFIMLCGCGAKRTDTKLDSIEGELYTLADELGIASPARFDSTMLEVLLDIDENSIYSYMGIMSLDDDNSDTILYIYANRKDTDKIMDKMREYSELFAKNQKYHIFRVIDRCFLIQTELADFDAIEERLTNLVR